MWSLAFGVFERMASHELEFHLSRRPYQYVLPR